jgi:hypothetical protein
LGGKDDKKIKDKIKDRIDRYSDIVTKPVAPLEPLILPRQTIETTKTVEV